MSLQVNRDNTFQLEISSDQLSKGLRPSKRLPRNNGYLVESIGMVGRDGVLQSLDEITRIDTSAITDPFPYPQIFIFTNLIIVCSQSAIYEWVSNALVSKISGLTIGSTWSAIDFYHFVLFTNGRVSVKRDSLSKAYSITTDYPHGTALCNFNGQVFVGAPDVDAPGISLNMPAGIATAHAIARGEYI